MTFQLPSYHILGYLSIPMFSTPPPTSDEKKETKHP
jgi:hypothetical protein